MAGNFYWDHLQKASSDMTPDTVMTLGRQAIEVTLLVSAPLLLVSLVIGLIISIFQAATQINETTLSFIPKLIGIFITLIIAGPWMLTELTDYLRLMLTSIPTIAG
jgi:flagellar biosynthesis protein FliQ